MKKTKYLAIFALFLVLDAAMFAEDAASIVGRSTTMPRPDFSRTQITVRLTDKAGNVETRQVIQFGNNKQNITQTTFDFRSPASYKNTRLLQQEKSNGQDQKWIYLPSLRTVRQIATADRKKDFVGTDFTYNDMTLRKAENDAHEFLDENAAISVAGKTYKVWKIKSVPVANKNVEYAYRVQFIDKESNLPVLTEFYDKTDKLLKTITTDELVQVSGATGKSYWFRKTQTAENKLTNHKTTIIVDKFEFDKPVSDNYFTQNWLNTGK